MLHIIPLSSFCPPKIDVALKITIGSKSKSDIKNSMMILRATSILGGQNEDKWMMCSITLVVYVLFIGLIVIKFDG
jgi:hypothetical protein